MEKISLHIQWDLGRELCLSTRDDFLCKTNGIAPANFFQRGKRNVRMVEGVPSNSAAIIDGMSLVQKVNTDVKCLEMLPI